MKMGLIQVIASVINKIYEVSGLIHPQGDVGMMGGIIIHQWNKQAADINQAQQGKEKKIKSL